MAPSNRWATARAASLADVVFNKISQWELGYIMTGCVVNNEINISRKYKGWWLRRSTFIRLGLIQHQERWPYSVIRIYDKLVVVEAASFLSQDLILVSIRTSRSHNKQRHTESYPVGGVVSDVASCNILQPLPTITLFRSIAFNDELQLEALRE